MRAFLCRSLFCVWLGPLALPAGQVVFSEVMYHPRAGTPEFVEVYNNTATPLDIAEWRLRGGVSFEFPAFSVARSNLTFLQPFERIVISGADVAATRAAYGIPQSVRLYGPWGGSLGNDGDTIRLEDKNGVGVCGLSYRDRGRWPVGADGAGHTLVLRNPDRAVDDWRNWRLSHRPGGTPGFGETAQAETPIPNPEMNLTQGLVLVDYADRWRFLDGGTEAPAGWGGLGFNDSAWGEGPGLLGFETAALPAPGLQTQMRDLDQITFYLRRAFNYAGNTAGAVLSLDQVLDDGAVYYLNGTEIGRSRMPAGTITSTVVASGTVGDAAEELNVFPINAALLRSGTNVLAVEVHQNGTTSSDVVFGARLRIATPQPPASGVVLNEVLPGESGVGFVEFYNTTRAAVDLGGFHLTDTAGQLTKWRIPGALVIAPGGFASVGFAEAGLAAASPLSVYLVARDGTSVENAIHLTLPMDGRSVGRKPDGVSTWYLFAEPTRDGPNESLASLAAAVRLNEVAFSASNTVSWVELYNPATNAVDVTGLILAADPALTNAVALSGSMEAGGRRVWDTAFPVLDGQATLFLAAASRSLLDARVVREVAGRSGVQAYPEGGTEWYASRFGTRALPNQPDRVTDVVINEIMYDPPSDARDGEFIELFNRGTVPVDLAGWRFAEGPDYEFPAGAALPPGGFLVVAANAARLRSVYGDIPVVGDFGGRLRNRGEMVRLEDAAGNLVDEVYYRVGGDWPELTQGNGSSLELVNPWLDNSLPSAWRDSDETAKAPFQTYRISGTYRQLMTAGTPTDYRELHLHLAGDGSAILQNIALRKDGTGTNLIVRGTLQSTNNQSASGWLAQGTHAASYVTNSRLYLVADGHGDNRANRVEIDLPGIAVGDNVVLTFDARWRSGTPRLIAQTWDHSVGDALRLEIPENLGTPGAANSAYQASPPPQIDGLIHSPAVPRPTQPVLVTARVQAAAPLASVELVHRLDTANADQVWQAKPMVDDGTGGDAMAGDGVYSAVLTEYQADGRIAQFYVRASTAAGGSAMQPKGGAARPAMLVVDDASPPTNLRSVRLVVSAYDLGAISGGNTAKYGYRYPRLSNHYYNATFIHNESEVFYNAEVRHSGSPWTRGGDLSRAKWKLPGDRRFRDHEKFYWDNDPAGGAMHHNRITRYFLYLLGHPANENEYVRAIINAGSPALREDTEPLGNDLLDRCFEDGSNGELYRIDDEWWFTDAWAQSNRDADWTYKGSDNPVRYHTEWMRRTREDDYDYSALINLFQTIWTTPYTQVQIERLLDADAILKMAAVRGYIQDWDWITLDRGKNGFLYRRKSDGRFQFMHWDSDLGFGNASGALFSGRPGVAAWLQKTYNRRRFFHYLSQLLDNYTQGSARMAAWLQAEEDANSSFTVASATYRNWFTSRRAFCLSQMGTNYLRPLEITTNAGQPITTDADTLDLAGNAPFAAYTIAIEGHPEAVASWNAGIIQQWSVTGIRLRSGVNQLQVLGLDEQGHIVRTVSLTVTRNGNGPPRAQLHADPASWHIGVDSTLALDGRDSDDPEDAPLQFDWQPPAELAAFEPQLNGTASAAFLRPGWYPFTLQVTDAAGKTNAVTREAAVHGPDGFSDFAGRALESFWSLRSVAYRMNTVRGSWLSLAEIPGNLVIQTPVDTALPLSGDAYPSVRRALPTAGDWSLETQPRLTTRQFGTFQAGVQALLHTANETRAYALALENGARVSALLMDTNGTVTTLASIPWDAEDARLRLRRLGAQLRFELRTLDVWTSLFTASLAADTLADEAGPFVATGLPQAVQVVFDYAQLVDPSNASDLRQNLRISEVMYNPVGGDPYEFVELANFGATTLQLSGVRFTEGIAYTFGPTSLAPGARIVVARDRTGFLERYGPSTGTLADGVYTGRLDNGGERLTLVDASGNLIQTFVYNDEGAWPARADGIGASLEILYPRLDYNAPESWNSSREYLGSPGRPGLTTAPAVVINEVLSHADPPYEDAIELLNTGTNTVNLGGWFLSDDAEDLKKFRIPAGIVLPPGGRWVVYQDQLFDPQRGARVPFQLDSAHGDDVWLTAADAAETLTLFVDHVSFGAAANGVSLGRYPDGTGDLTAMEHPTFGVEHPADVPQFRLGQGAANAAPRIGPVVFSRILYDAAAGAGEFIELANITGAPVPLFDPLHTTNTWSVRNAVDFVFPTNVTLSAGGRLLLVPIEPALFRSMYSIPSETQVFGPYVGALANEGESLELYQPDPPETQTDIGFVPQVLAEKVRYNNRAPWPELATTGTPLQRRSPVTFGNDPASWFTDLDGDGLPDDWEIHYLLSPYDAGDADTDVDGDGWSNRQEFAYGTDPLNPEDALRLREVVLDAGGMGMSFTALAGWNYIVEVSQASPGGPWATLVAVPGGDANHTARVADPQAGLAAARFYRVRTTGTPR